MSALKKRKEGNGLGPGSGMLFAWVVRKACLSWLHRAKICIIRSDLKKIRGKNILGREKKNTYGGPERDINSMSSRERKAGCE